jgi:hypothetical protein
MLERSRLQTHPAPFKTKSPALIALAVALIVVVVTAGAVAGLVYFTHSQDQNSSTSPKGSNGSHGGSGSNGSWGSNGSGGSNGTGGTVPPTNNPILYKLWTDPKEGAFTALLPSGWSVSSKSGVSRPYFSANFNFSATDSSGLMQVFFAKSGYPILMEPLPPTDLTCVVYTSQGLTPPADCIQGSLWAPFSSAPSAAVYVWPYLAAQDFAKQLVLTQLQKTYPDASLVSSSNRPDLASSSVNIALTQTTTGADALYSYTSNGVSYRMGMVITTSKLAANTVGGAPFNLWIFDYSGVSAPASDFSAGKNATKAYAQIIPTVRVSKTWLQNEVQNQAVDSQLISQTFTRIQQMDYRSFVDTSNSIYASGEAWGNALGGVQDYADSSGVVHTIETAPLGYDYVWGDSLGNVAYTSTDQSPGSGYVQWHTCTSMSCGT